MSAMEYDKEKANAQVQLAQKYLEQHESRVSRTHLYMEELRKRMRLLKRSFSNIKTYLIPWEGKIKRIESHFGSVVSSYFTFLRWIVFVNVIITLIILALVVLPEALADAAADESRRNRTESRKEIPSNERIHADEIAVVWHYDGYLRYSPLFYGYYSDDEFLWQKYPLPLAYFLVTIFIFAYSFFAILRKMAANARMSKLSGSKAEQYIFNWRVFTGWDYTIGNQDTASNTVMAIVIKLRESIADCRVSIGSKFRCLQFTLRVIANLVICGMLAFSIYCISFAVQKSQTAVEQEGNLFTKNQVPSVVATITHVFPMIFDLIGRLENYHPRTALRAHLTRVLVLYVLNYLTLIVALFDKMDAIRRKEPVDTLMYRKKRQLGGRNPNLPRPPPYASRTFENRTDLLRFIAKSTQRFGQTRTTREVLTTPFTVRIFKDVKRLIHKKEFFFLEQVAPQFGPVNVNNPNAILRNGTLRKIFEAKRIGPDPLPIYTPPPRTHPPYEPGNVKESFGGPDFSTTSSPRTYTRTTKQPIRITKPATTKKVTVANTVSGKTETTKATSSSNAAPNDNLSDSEDPARNFLQANETMRLPAAAERRSSADEVYNTDICWETIIGQEIVKLVTMDLIVTIVSILVIDFLRGLWIKYCSAWWCWDIETTFPEYGEFKVAENVLHIINNQGMIWLGLFFAPLLPALNNIKLVIKQFLFANPTAMVATVHVTCWIRDRLDKTVQKMWTICVGEKL
ncbi:TMC domain protein [Necator americanus]|uniref:TMC domain protein n=1 Tax=Necator americanus TaxID=51031 RepID=W2TGK7_NECAM|nr:TMC domain protein [Necator americanus]ETN80296.1 TMC domain protein [Necator americanus]